MLFVKMDGDISLFSLSQNIIYELPSTTVCIEQYLNPFCVVLNSIITFARVKVYFASSDTSISPVLVVVIRCH